MLRYTCNGLASLLLIFYGTLYPALQACAYGHDKTSNMTYLQSFDIATYQGSRLLLFIYSITDSRSGKAIELLNDLYSVRSEFNIDIVGICIDTGKENTVRSYHNSHAAAFPIFIDATGNLYKQLRMSGSVALYLYSKNGDLLGRSFGSYLPPHADLSHVWRIYIDRYINIGFIPSDRPFLGLKPAVPLFSAQTLSGHTINIQDLYKKKPLVIVIFSSTCITCNEELGFLNSLYTNAELGGTFEIVGISRHNREITSRLVQKKKFDFPVIIDTESRYSALFPSFIGPVPISYLIDRQGRIHYVHHNYNTRHNDIYTMELRKLIGKPSEPLLDPEGYSGHDRCVICHEQQHHQWYLTRHAAAINSLKRKGREDDPACIACHVTGYGQTGGYSLQDPAASGHLEGVQCEACHGPGHTACSDYTRRAPVKKKARAWKRTCLACHTAKESLNFSFARRYPDILHDSAPNFFQMGRAERLKLIRTVRRKKNLFANPAAHVGAEQCRKCHELQYDHWQSTKHAVTHTTPQALSAAGEMLFRYHTGVGHAGGYPEPGRAGVQCEACHGPGEKHLSNPTAKGHSYIVGLGAECPNCVVEQICRRCHELSDDPDFVFETHINSVRHTPAE